MNFKILLSLSIIVCAIGLTIRLVTWFSQGISPATLAGSTGSRTTAAVRGLVSTVFSIKILQILKSLIVDLLFQKRIFDKNYLRWSAHTLIFSGFILLFLFHALGSVVSESLFSNYQPTLNPFLFLRNIFGLMVLAGLGLAVYRRIKLKPQRLKTYPGDWAAIVFVAVIILSGMLLEGAKMTSYSTYQRMVDEYSAAADEAEALALEAYWVSENGLASPNFKQLPGVDQIEAGEAVHSESCIDCHASNTSAFASYALSGIGQGIIALIGDSAAVTMFWYLHILACLGFLAWIPFSKMFHIVSAPVSLVIKRVTDDGELEPANLLNRQMIGLSACTHCGSCSIECSASMFYETLGNDFILPSEKVQYLKDYADNKVTDPDLIKRLQQGLYVCTSCDRCTNVCPSGINLREIFVAARYTLLEKGIPETSMLSHFSFPLALANNFVDDHLKALKKVTLLFKQSFQHLTDLAGPITINRAPEAENNSFKGCYSCQRCTNICPVVRSFDNPAESLGLLPHQIMYSLGIGNRELALGSQMIWSCSTCYLCQEHCPNQVELCDIFYSLKNSAIKKIDAGVI
jgi:heterodisulfide reductase subunit C/nitrate reductase gamma subunit